MRLHEEPLIERITEALEAIGLPKDLSALAEQYLEEGENLSAREELYKGLKRKDLSSLPDEQLGKCHTVAARLDDKDKKELYRKFIDILFGMGGATAKYAVKDKFYANMFGPVYLREKGVCKLQTVSLTAEEFSRNTEFSWQGFSQWVANTEVDLETIQQALEYINPDCTNGEILLNTAYLYLHDKKAGGRLQSGDEKIVRRQESIYSRNMGVLFKMELSDEEEEVIGNYIKQNEDTSHPVPAEITSILLRGSMSSFLAGLLVGTAFMNIKYSKVFANLVQVSLAVDAQRGLNGIYKAVQRKYFDQCAPDMDKRFCIPEDKYIEWNAEYNKSDEVLKDRLEKSRDSYVRVLQNTGFETANKLLALLKKMGKSLSREEEEEIKKLNESMMRKIISNVTERNPDLADIATNYMDGTYGMDKLLEEAPKISSVGTTYYSNHHSMLKEYVNGVGEDSFYERALVYFTVLGSFYFFSQEILSRPYGQCNKEFLDKLYAIYEKHGLPLYYRIHLYEEVCNISYDAKAVAALKTEMEEILVGMIRQKREEVMEAVVKLGPTGRIAVFSALLAADSKNEAVLFDYFGDTSKQVKEMLTTMFRARKQSMGAVIRKLSSKKAAERETAVMILTAWKTEPACREALENALTVEKSAKLAALLHKELGMDAAEGEKDGRAEGSAEDYVKDLHKGNRKRSLAWLYETPMPSVHRENGEAAEEEYLQAVLLSYSTQDTVGVNAKARQLTACLNQRELEYYAGTVFDKWLEKGAESKKKWVLYFSSIHGGTEMVQKLKHWIGEWPQHSRGAIAVEAVKALALNGTPAALLMVDGISRKFKFRQVKEAAGAALTLAAEELGITTEELADKIVPNLGFEENGERIFDYGTRTFKVLISPALELEIYDAKGKQVKNLPAPGAADKETEEQAKQAYGQFKELKKLMKTTVATQRLRLELALSMERKWPAAAWESLFVKNPLMHQFAIGLIWGCYRDGVLVDTFRYMEEGNLNTAQEEELELTDDCLVGLVHPLELQEEQLDTWKEQLSDYEIVQPLEQLERKVYAVEETEKGKKELERFGGYIINNLSLTGKLMAEGWYRGSVQDAGGYYEFFKEDTVQGIGAELEFSGAYVGGDFEDVTIYEVRFYRSGTVSRGSYVYDRVKPENTFCLEEVPKRFFSETVYQLTKVLASSSSNRNPDWKKH